MNNLYGTPVMTISQIVKNLMIEQGNSNQNHYADNLVRATRVFKDLLKDTIWSIRYKALDIDKSDNSVCMPQDMVRLYNINVVDHCGQLVPLGYNPLMNTMKLMCHEHKCSCTSCKGTGTLCDALDAIQVITEDVVINGVTYPKKTWIQKCNDGVIKKVIELPYPDDVDNPQSPVSYVTEYETLCDLEVTVTNCIKSTEANHMKLLKYCGCYIPGWQSKMCGLMVNYGFAEGPLSPAMNLTDMNPKGIDAGWIKDYYCENKYFPQSNFGYWNWGVNAHEKVYLKMIRTEKVIVCYQTNGDNCSGEELVIPEYALDAMQFGIVYRQRAFAPNVSYGEKQAARMDYEREKDKLKRFLHLVSPEALASLQEIIPKW